LFTQNIIDLLIGRTTHSGFKADVQCANVMIKLADTDTDVSIADLLDWFCEREVWSILIKVM